MNYIMSTSRVPSSSALTYTSTISFIIYICSHIIFSDSPPGSGPPAAGRRPAGRRASRGGLALPSGAPSGPSVSGYGKPHGYVLYLLYRGLSVDTEIHTHITHKHTYTYTYIHAAVRRVMYIRLYTYMYIYVYIYIYTNSEIQVMETGGCECQAPTETRT